MSKHKKMKKNYKTPKIKDYRNPNNPPTIITYDVFTEEDTKKLIQLNIYPLIIKGNYDEPFVTIYGNTYHNMQMEDETYAILDVNEFLKNYDIETEVRLLLQGRENPILHHGRVVKGDIILYTEDYKIPLSAIINETLGLTPKEPSNTKQITRPH